MIGEMALFDLKPRSASVKATRVSDVTWITNDDFRKLVSQIPKWFTTLMITLSTRLRTTNDRVQMLSDQLASMQQQQAPHMQNLKKALVILREVASVWQLEGRKEADAQGKKSIHVPIKSLAATLQEKFKLEPADFARFVKGLGAQGFIVRHGATLAVANKAELNRFVSFLDDYLSRATFPCLGERELRVLDMLEEHGKKVAYDTFMLSFQEIKDQMHSQGPSDEQKWRHCFAKLRVVHEDLQPTNTPEGRGYRIRKQEIREPFYFHRVLSSLVRSLSR